MSQNGLAQASRDGDETLPVGQPQSSIPQENLRDVWKRGIGTFVNTLQKHTKPVTAVAISRDGKLIASASYDCTVNLWETSTGSFKKDIKWP
jgi:WD40 repeat protein